MSFATLATLATPVTAKSKLGGGKIFFDFATLCHPKNQNSFSLW
jgi:hypothetical protein